MTTFGENLKREREMRGVTLEEISTSTKISIRFLKALEDENFTKLPGGIFTRSFIRAYASYLGLDEEHVLAEYHLLVPTKGDNDLSRIAKTRPLPRREGARGTLLAILVAGVLLSAGYFLYRYQRTPGEVRPPPSVVVPAVPTPAPLATDPGPSGAAAQDQRSPQQQSGVPAPRASSLPLSGGPALLTLQVAATDRSWVAVDADGKMVLQRILSPGEFETLQAKESFDVTTGNAQGIVLTLNGETLKPLGRRGEVKTVRLTANDAKKISP